MNNYSLKWLTLLTMIYGITWFRTKFSVLESYFKCTTRGWESHEREGSGEGLHQRRAKTLRILWCYRANSTAIWQPDGWTQENQSDKYESIQFKLFVPLRCLGNVSSEELVWEVASYLNSCLLCHRRWVLLIWCANSFTPSCVTHSILLLHSTTLELRSNKIHFCCSCSNIGI